MTIATVTEAAGVKFGTVIAAVLTESQPHGDFFLIACKREKPATNDAPFMVITGKYDKEPHVKERVYFFNGHYDLDAKAAAKIVKNHQIFFV